MIDPISNTTTLSYHFGQSETRSLQKKTAFRIVLATGRDAVDLVLTVQDRTWGSIELFGSLAV